MKNFGVFFAFLFAGLPCIAQNTASDLDFWLGEWNLRWSDTDSTEASGTNSITRELNDKVISEHFQATDGKFAGFEGRSWSVLDARTQTWKQTWVDNQGGYLDFTGGKDGDTVVFQRQLAGKDGNTIRQKMVFHDIGPRQFTWDWMRSNDDGQSWQLAWRIYYTRK